MKLFLIIFLTLIGANTVCGSWLWSHQENSSTCAPYVCSSCPLYCGALDVQVQGGAAPTIWQSRKQVRLGSGGISPINPVLQFFNSPHFDTFFVTPWIVGGQVGYAVLDYIRLYGEVNYIHAKGKRNSRFNTVTNPAFPAVIAANRYHSLDAFFGARYYTDRWCNYIAAFVGAKIGLIHHRNTQITTTVAIPAQFILSNLNVLQSNTYIAGGVNGGLDICFCGGLSFVLTAECVVSAGPKINNSIALTPALGRFTSLAFGTIGAEIRFPLTVGVRYSF